MGRYSLAQATCPPVRALRERYASVPLILATVIYRKNVGSRDRVERRSLFGVVATPRWAREDEVQTRVVEQPAQEEMAGFMREDRRAVQDKVHMIALHVAGSARRERNVVKMLKQV